MSENSAEQLTPLNKQIHIAEHLTAEGPFTAFENSDYHHMQQEQTIKGLPFLTLEMDFEKTTYTPETVTMAKKFLEAARDNNCAVSIITGLSYDGLMDYIQKTDLPYPQVIGVSVGTDIRFLHGFTPEGQPIYVQDESYGDMLEKSGYQRRQIANEAQSIINDLSQTHPEWRLDFQTPEMEKKYIKGEELNPQEQRNLDQNQYKVSFYFYGEKSQELNVKQELEQQFPNAQIVTCGEIHYNAIHKGDPIQKFCADVLPATKGHALRYIDEVRKLTTSESQDTQAGLRAGDSGNDLPFILDLIQPNRLSVLVGGAADNARDKVDEATLPEYSSRSWRRVIATESTELIPFFVEPNENKRAIQSVIRAARFSLLAAMQRPNLNPQTRTYLKHLYEVATGNDTPHLVAYTPLNTSTYSVR